jgi:hypothetical protein
LHGNDERKKYADLLGTDHYSEEPCGRDRRASEIEYLFSVSFPLVGNPSDLFGIARKILDKPE